GLSASYDIFRIKIRSIPRNVAPEFLLFLPFIPNATREYNGQWQRKKYSLRSISLLSKSPLPHDSPGSLLPVQQDAGTIDPSGQPGCTQKPQDQEQHGK